MTNEELHELIQETYSDAFHYERNENGVEILRSVQPTWVIDVYTNVQKNGVQYLALDIREPKTMAVKAKMRTVNVEVYKSVLIAYLHRKPAEQMRLL